MHEHSVIKEEIIKRYPGTRFTVLSTKAEEDAVGVKMSFENGMQKDYCFIIRMSIFYEANIYIHADLKGPFRNRFFWKIGFGWQDRRSRSPEKIRAFLFETLDILLNHKTRIIQTKNGLTQEFELEYFKNNKWIPLKQRHQGLFFGWNYTLYTMSSRHSMPEIEGMEKIYE